MARILPAAGFLLLSSSSSVMASSSSPPPPPPSFTYTEVNTVRYATPLPSPLVISKPYAPAFTDASTLLPDGVTYTTYSYNPTATFSPDDSNDKYGQSAYNALWASANLTWSSSATDLPITTTVSPTPVPSSELIYPPPLPFKTLSSSSSSSSSTSKTRKLPADFMWGVSSSAWQVEGALQSEGRGPSPAVDSLGSNLSPETDDGITNTLNYFLYKQDIARIAALGVPYYSFSISWPRILPFGVAGSPVNEQAIAHYDDLIETCLEYGVKPVATLWHFDTPASVDLADDSLIDDFIYYAQVVMTHFADRVPLWYTFNEPNIGFTYLFDDYKTVTRMALAHGEVYHWYKSTLGGNGQVSLKFANNLAYPLNGPGNASDVAAADRYQSLTFGLMANPIFLGRQIPDSALQDTKLMGLEPYTEEQLAKMKGTADFFAIDPYTAQFAAALPENEYSDCISNASDVNFPFCVTLSNTLPSSLGSWAMGQPSEVYVYIAPQYVRQQLKYISDTYRPKGGIVISEFGFPVLGESGFETQEQVRFDTLRSMYYEDFMREVMDSIYEDGVKVTGATAWTMTDNNEWGNFGARFGLQTVDREGEGATWERKYKRSFFDYVDLFRENVEGAGGER